MVLLIGILVFAHPALRLKYHNNFEVTHRFMGWAAVGLVWALVRIYNQEPTFPSALREDFRLSPSIMTIDLKAFPSGRRSFTMSIFG